MGPWVHFSNLKCNSNSEKEEAKGKEVEKKYTVISIELLLQQSISQSIDLAMQMN